MNILKCAANFASRCAPHKPAWIILRNLMPVPKANGAPAQKLLGCVYTTTRRLSATLWLYVLAAVCSITYDAESTAVCGILIKCLNYAWRICTRAHQKPPAGALCAWVEMLSAKICTAAENYCFYNLCNAWNFEVFYYTFYFYLKI